MTLKIINGKLYSLNEATNWSRGVVVIHLSFEHASKIHQTGQTLSCNFFVIYERMVHSAK